MYSYKNPDNLLTLYKNVHSIQIRLFAFYWFLNIYNVCYDIGGFMVSVLASSAVDRVFEPRSSQTKCYKIFICCCFSMYTALRKQNKD